MKSLRIFCDPDSLAKEIAQSCYDQAMEASKNRSVFSVVLSGGNTDPVLYTHLAKPEWKSRVPWQSVHIFFADERCVPPDDDESNFKIISYYLLDHIPIPEKNIHRIRGEDDPKEEILRYTEDIKKHLILRKGKSNLFDWVFLGVGPDGHTASLFPGHNLSNSSRLCEVAQHPETGQNRVTMTPFAINNSDRITYHVIGGTKAEIVGRLASSLPTNNIYPALQIQGEWFLDKESASKLDVS